MLFGKKISVLAGALILSILSLVGCKASLKTPGTGSININDAMTKKQVMPIVIIGSGPAGLSAALYGVWGSIPTLVIHGPKPGGLLMETSVVENWPGHKEILGADIIKNLQNHVKAIGTKFLNGTVNKIQFLEDTVTEVNIAQWPYALTTEQGLTIHAMTVIIATGANPRLLEVPGEKEYWSRGVTACAVCDAPFFKGKDVVVVGAGDSAAEEAMQLAKYAKNVTILGRKEKLRAAASMQTRLKEYPSISVQYNVEVKKIVGDAKSVTGVELYNNKTQQTNMFQTNGVFLAIGHVPNSDLFKNVVTVDGAGYIQTVGRSQMTSVAGIFAAGDVEDNTYRQAGVAAGSGIKAALDAIAFLNHIGYSPAVSASLEPHMYRAPASGVTVQDVDTQDYQEKVEKADGVVAVLFSPVNAEDAHDAMSDAELAAVSQKFDGRVNFARVKSHNNVDLAHKLHVDDEPCVVVYNQGKIVARYAGAITSEELTTMVHHVVEPGYTEIV